MLIKLTILFGITSRPPLRTRCATAARSSSVGPKLCQHDHLPTPTYGLLETYDTDMYQASLFYKYGDYSRAKYVFDFGQ